MSHTLICAECGAPSDEEATGWRAYLDDDDCVVLFCAGCAAREFGFSGESPTADGGGSG